MKSCIALHNQSRNTLLLMVILSGMTFTYLFYQYPDVIMQHRQSEQHITTKSGQGLRSNECHACFRYDFNRVIAPQSCRRSATVKLIFLITTIPRESSMRNAIRQTWLSWKSKHIRHLFLFGATTNQSEQNMLQKEHAKYQDILQDDFVESYYNLSQKVIMGFKWVSEECPQAQYIVRTACDNYVNVPQILEFLSEFKSEIQNAWFGTCISPAPVVRNRKHKWYISRDYYPKSIFPPYCIGTTFIMPFKVMNNFLHTYADTPHFILEDCYFGLCALKFNVDVLDVNGFNAACSDRSSSALVCPYYNQPVFSIHPVKKEEKQFILHSTLTARSLLSKKQLRSHVKLTCVNHGLWQGLKEFLAANAPEFLNRPKIKN